MSRSLTTSASTASPRNSSRSLSLRDRAARLVHPRRVGHRRLAQRRVAERVADDALRAARTPSVERRECRESQSRRRPSCRLGSDPTPTCCYYPAMSEATNLCCVKCNSVLDRGSFQGLEVDLCPKCGGLWLDRGEITRAAKLPEAELDRLRGLLTGKAGPPPVPTENKAPCPACPGSLAEICSRRRPRRLLQQVPRHLPGSRRAAARRRGRPRPLARHRRARRRHRDSTAGD